MAYRSSTTRNTLQRTAVLDAVRSLHFHPTAHEVYEKVLKEHPHISKATVYRNLHVLVDRGEILCAHIQGEPDRYDHTTEPHYHIICSQCGAVADIFIDRIPEITLSNPDGYHLDGYSLSFEGICPDCQGKN